MKKTEIVLIDRNSITKNPKAGNTTLTVAGPTEITFTYIVKELGLK